MRQRNGSYAIAKRVMMRCACLSFGVLFIAVPSYSQWKEKAGKWETVKFVQTKPAKNWDTAYGVGNGRLAAKVLGNVKNEKIFLNDNTFWPGRPRNFSDPAALNTLKQVRQLLLAGKNPEADALSKQLEGFDCEPYIATGNLFLDFIGGSSTANYKNILEMDSAMVKIQYTIDGVNYTRVLFISYPDQVLVMRIFSDKSGGLGFDVRLNSIDVDNNALPFTVTAEGTNSLVMKGFSGYGSRYAGEPDEVAERLTLADTSEMKFDARVKVLTSGGGCTASGSSLKVSGADTALLILSIATSYNGPFKHPSPSKEGLNPTPIAKDYLDKAATKTYQQLLATHLQDYQGIFRRMWIDVNGENPGGRALDLQYTRFETIQCSRGSKGEPMTLKGIWNDKNRPEWFGHYTMNSEGPKTYWTAEIGNIAETVDPVTNFVEELAQNGAKTAKVNYGCRGWVAHHNCDLWKQSSMVGGKGLATCCCCWMFGGIFMAELLSEHYKFSGDVKYLREHAYPVLKGAAEFALDWLIDDGKGNLTVGPSTSPENLYTFTNGQSYGVCLGSTGDLAHIRQVFLDVIAFSKVLGVDAGFRDSLEAAYKRIYPFKIGSKGQLQEWAQDWGEPEPQHRHASHMLAVYPYSLITPRGTPDLWKAAIRSMELRGGGAFLPTKHGWWSRLLNGDKALAYLPNPNGPSRYTRTYAGFPETLLQSHVGEIELLPALPSSLPSGRVLGLRARTGYEVDIEWANSKLTKTTIRTAFGTIPKVRIQGEVVPDPKTDPRITIVDVSTGVEKTIAGPSIGKTIAITRLSDIAIPYRGAYTASVLTIRGQVVESVRGIGPATVRLVPRNWAAGLYILTITAGDGCVTVKKPIHHTGRK